MEIIKHFTIEKKTFTVLSLNDAEWDSCFSIFPDSFLDCYVTKEDLDQRISTFGKTRTVELGEILPTEGNIQSGDFGEIICYFIFKEMYKRLNADGPKKWRWKQQNNTPAPFTDVLLFHKVNKVKPHRNDHLISVESKMKAVTNKSYQPIKNAIEGAEKDYVSRIAQTLVWLRKKYKDESLKVGASKSELIELVNQVERYINSETTGEYVKHLKAVAIVDKSFVDDELSIAYTTPTLNGVEFEIIVVSVKDLQKAYQKVYSDILST